MKMYQHAEEIMHGKSMIAVAIAAAEILSDREQIGIAMEQQPKESSNKPKFTVEGITQQIADAKIEILAHAETAYCCEKHKSATFKSARYQIAMIIVKLIADETFPRIAMDMFADKLGQFFDRLTEE